MLEVQQFSLRFECLCCIHHAMSRLYLAGLERFFGHDVVLIGCVHNLSSHQQDI